MGLNLLRDGSKVGTSSIGSLTDSVLTVQSSESTCFVSGEGWVANRWEQSSKLGLESW